MKKTNTKKSLVLSVLSMLLCVTMLVGTTAAWFTDTASTNVNTIQAGKLDIALRDAEGNSLEGQTLTFAKAENAPEGEAILFEPGAKYAMTQVWLHNEGNLHAKYQVVITGIDGDSKLAEVLDVYVAGEKVGTLMSLMVNNGIVKEGFIAPDEVQTFGTIELMMQTTAGNEYQGLSLEGIAITVYATQKAEEYDSEGNQYDAEAEYDPILDKWDGTLSNVPEAKDDTIVITTAEEFAGFAASVNAGNDYVGVTVKLSTGIDLDNLEWAPINNFAGTFDGQDHMVKNLKFSYASEDAGQDWAGPAFGLFGTVTGTIQNLMLDTVNADFDIPVASRPRGVFGFMAYSLKGTAENCHVKDVTVTTTGRFREAGGMFCNVSGTATNCTITNVSIKTTSTQATWTFEDMGGFAGVVTGKLEECSATNVTISANPDRSNYKKVGGFIGRTNINSVVTDCSVKDVFIYANNQFDHVGGFVGHAENTGNATFTNCSVENVTLTVDKTSSGKTGGFAGEAKGCTLTNCSVSGATISVGTEGGSYAIGSTSGFCGQTNGDGATFVGCTVTGLNMTLKGTLENGIGGFLTSTGGAGGTFTNCSVEGKIQTDDATNAVGGFLGNLGWGGEAHVVIEGSVANVAITAPENTPVGGFVGKASSTNVNATLTVTNCTATSNATQFVGFAGIGTFTNCKINGQAFNS